MINVIKATGEIEPFSEGKLRSSIQRAGVPKEYQDKLINYIKANLYDNIHTAQIYKHITDFFKQNNSYARARYSLKQSLMDLGPTGYPFEDYVSDILENEGYKTQVRLIIQGKCISHEIDVVAEKNGKKIIIEAKFHNAPGIKTDCHVAMYTKARFDDICQRDKYDEAWIVTNTKVTEDALAFALCNDMKVVSWSYPENESLRDLIERLRLFPVTALSTLSQLQKQQLMQEHVIMCKHLVEKPSVLDSLGIQGNKKTKILEEAKFVYQRS
jgi:hypothetical protein